MTIEKCIIDAVEDGHIGQEKADEIIDEFERLIAGDRVTGRAWKKKAAGLLEAERARKHSARMHAARTQADKNKALKAKVAEHGERYAKAVLLEDHSNEFPGVVSVEGRSRDLFKEALAPITDGIFRFKQKLNPLDRKSVKAQNEDLLAAAYGEQGASAEARAFTDGLEAGKNKLVRHTNRHGGSIKERKRHIITQSHDVDKIRAAGKEKWIRDTAPLVDPSQLFDAAGNTLEGSDLKVDEFLDAAYDAIMKEGMSDSEFVTELNNLAHHRAIAFDGSKAHLEYASKYGNDDIFGSMLNDLEHRSKLAASTEVLGPDPRSAIRAMKGEIPVERASKISTIDQFYDQALGFSDPFSGTKRAAFSRAVRMIASAAKLGAAPITALVDAGSIARTMADSAGWAAVPRAYGQMLRQLNPASGADRKTAARMEFVADRLTGAISVGSRFLGEGQKAGWSDVVADQVFRKTGLTHWTDAGRSAVPMAFLDTLTSEAGKAFDQLPTKVKRTLERNGIGAGDWDNLRSASIWTSPDNGSEWLSVDNMVRDTDTLPPLQRLEARDQAMATRSKFQAMFRKLSEQGVFGATGRSQVALRFGAKKGSAVDEIGLKNLLLWKSIIGGMFDIVGGATKQRYKDEGTLAAINYAGGMMVALTAFGGLAVQLSNISKGRNPEDMTSGQFVWKSIVKGGGLGIGGDLVDGLARGDKYAFLKMLGGPIAGGAIADASAIVTQKDRVSAARKAVGWAIPGSEAWYTRLAVERMLGDQIHKMLDDEADRTFRRREKSLRSSGGSYFWRPGETLQ